MTDLADDAKTFLLFCLGYRSSVDANDVRKSDYQREHIYNYLNLAAKVKIPCSETTLTTVDFGVETLLSGTATSILSEADPSLPNIEMNFKGGTATKLGISVNQMISVGTIYLSLNYKEWKLKQSEVAITKVHGTDEFWVKPHNSTRVLALEAGLLF